MRLSRRLAYSAVVSLALAATGSGLILLNAAQQRRSLQRVQTMDTAVRTIFDLRTTLSDYGLHGLERARIQWLQRHQDFSVLLTANQGVLSTPPEVWRELTENHETIGKLFEQLCTVQEEQRAQGSSTDLQRAHLLGRIHIYLVANLRLIEDWMMRTYEVVRRQQRHTVWLAWTTGVLMFGVVAVLAATLQRSVIGPVLRLRGAAVEVGKGDLGRRVCATSRDEIGDLGRAINRMLADLERTTISRDRLEAEASRRRTAEERLRAALEELRVSNRELAQFAYIASHDLQEPLRSIVSFAELLARRYRDRMGEDAEAYIDFILQGARRMHLLIQDLLTYSRVTSGELAVEPIAAQAALDEAEQNLQALIESSGAQISADSLPPVTANHAQLVRLFQNLIANAIKFRGRQAPRIRVTVEKEGDDPVFAVRDNGIGIDPAYHERIFSLFKRLHPEDDYPGTGIGLPVCKRIVERLGGRIWLESALGEGSTFYFTLGGHPARGPKERHADSVDQ
jgi:signal transduction histidine kinase